jgi:hypothetical protein
VGTVRPIRVHIQLDDALVSELDARVPPRQRSAFIAQLVRAALDDQLRWDDIESALGAIPDAGHDWDDDPAARVRQQRSADGRRVG